MDIPDRLTEAIDQLTQAVETAPHDTELLLQRGKLYHQTGAFHMALNDFMRVKHLSGSHPEAEGYILLLREIFAFRHFDSYNP